ncbi:MAG: GNAT family N-acetyltransferase [Rhizobiales bacterium]|nr:GNAT family N-acetyltransferase [Hyphomicrobiales bacterium]MBP9174868.1 GNAT family N-acetyltransferase [Hyphomicrobiales bacterium]
MTIEITPLKPDSPELEICAAWRYEAFLKSCGYSLDENGAQLAKLATQPDEYETALIALADGHLAGICLLVLREFEPLHDVSPWLASLYVAPEFRKRGVARMLVAAIEEQARGHGVARLHFYTGDAEKFYLKCGWSLAEQGVADGEPYAFMIRDL